MRLAPSQPQLAGRLTLVFCLLVCCESVFSFPWGPYVVPRSGKRSGYGLFPEFPDSGYRCCPFGAKSSRVRRVLGEELKFDCPVETPCCSGLREVVRVVENGDNYHLCLHKLDAGRNSENDNFIAFTRLLKRLDMTNTRFRRK